MDRALALFFRAGQPVASHLPGGANLWYSDAWPRGVVDRRSPLWKEARQNGRSHSGQEVIPLERDQAGSHRGTRSTSMWGRYQVGLPPQSVTEESNPAKSSAVIFYPVHVRRDYQEGCNRY